MPFLAALPAILGAGSSIFGSLLSGKPKTTTTTNTPTLTPQMQEIMDHLLAYGTSEMGGGADSSISKMKNASIDSVNRNYMGVPSRLSSQFAARGYGSSGSFGNSQYNTEYQRQGDLSGLESKFAGMGLDQQNFGAGLNSQLLNFGKGSTSTSTGPDTSGGNALMSGGNALSNLSQLLMFSNVLKNGGSGGGGGGTYNGDSSTGYGG